MIPRQHLSLRIDAALRRSPVCALLGPRQCGKTTLARTLAGQRTSSFYDLEDPADFAALQQSPKLLLEPLKGLVILDEIQLSPELMPVLRVLADRTDDDVKFLILGSASPNLVHAASESLAGRLAFVDMGGFVLPDVGVGSWRKLWLQGGFPRSFLADTADSSYAWRGDFIRTFLDRDLPQMGLRIPAHALRRFWTMVAHYHGQIWNGSEFARSIGATEPTARRYLDLLHDAYVVRQLPPWHENLKKRQVKSPKVYVRDSGILHHLLSLPEEGIFGHPKLGASWEGFVIEQILAVSSCREAYFWATHAGAELDLLLFHKGRRLGFEVKYTDAPRNSKSMHIAMQDLGLDHLYVVYPGIRSYPMSDKVDAISIHDLNSLFQAS